MRAGLGVARGAPVASGTVPTLFGRRVLLRPLAPSDFPSWRDVRRRNVEWLTRWEPRKVPGQVDVVEDIAGFTARCTARDRERQAGSGSAFGVFVDGYFAGEMNLGSIQRGAYQNAYVGYWIDQDRAGEGYTPEALVVALRHGFDDLSLHRLQISIIPRNRPSRRVVEKLDLRSEGVAHRYLEINGVWEDHIRYAITAEEWEERGSKLLGAWVD